MNNTNGFAQECGKHACMQLTNVLTNFATKCRRTSKQLIFCFMFVQHQDGMRHDGKLLKRKCGTTKIPTPCPTSKQVTLQTTPQQSTFPTATCPLTPPDSPRIMPKITQLLTQATQKVTETLTPQVSQHLTGQIKS